MSGLTGGAWRARPVRWLPFATLLRRELRRGLKDWLDTGIAPVLSTLLYLAVFVFALGPERGSPAGADLLRFIVPGLVLYTVVMRAAEATVFSLMIDRLEGLVGDVLMPPLSALEITAAYALAGAAAGLVTGGLALAAAAVLVDLSLARPALAFAFCASTGLMAALTGVLVGLWAQRWDHVAAFFGFVLVPLTFLSGLFVPVGALPRPLAVIARSNPLFYAIDGLRSAFAGPGIVAPGVGLVVVLGCGAALAVLAHRLIARGWRLKA